MKKTAAERSLKQHRAPVEFNDGSLIFEFDDKLYTAVNEYDRDALIFLMETNTELVVNFSHTGPHFESDEEKRDIYNITLSNNRHAYTFTYGDSIHNTDARLGKWSPMYPGRVTLDARDKAVKKAKQEHRKPGAYDILACLTEYDIGSFDNFCDEFGYNNDSISARKTYFAVQKEFDNVSRLFTEEQLEKLSEIN
jgi:hypothetical protein